jgi:RimJ/RimL family protein N-acetyltransferase
VIEEASHDPYIPAITSVPAEYTPAGGVTWLERQWHQAAQDTGYPLAVTLRSTGETIGFAAVNGINRTHGRAAVGYWILDRHRGHGYARRALALLPDIATGLGIIRLEALIEVDNPASQATCRAVGFVEEGTLRSYMRIGDRQRDMVIFSRILT